MSTRASIAMIQSDGTIRAIYNHWDGYPEGVGKILIENYTTPALITKLLDLGDISSLGASPEPSELTRRFGFDGTLTSEFNKLNRTEQTRLEAEDRTHTLAYGRDRNESDTAAIIYKSIAEWYRHAHEEYNYLFKDGQWYLYYNSSLNRVDAEIKHRKELENAHLSY